MADSKDADAAAAPPVAMFKKGRSRPGNIRKRPPTPPPKNSDSDSDDSSDDGDEAMQGPKAKRRRQNAGAVTASSGGKAGSDIFTTTYQADRSAPITDTNDATKRSNWYEEETTAKAKVGPKQASSNVRTITTFDFKPDICKDYKKTGFCGFGDNCIFLHDRGDYKQGWQLDKEWEDVTKGKKNLGGTVVASANRDTKAGGEDEDEEEAMLENIPFACIICEGPYKAPVVTRCGHYFCEPCALKRYRKDPTCAACGAGTSGVFNSASRLKKLLERKKERAAKARQAAIDAGEEVSDEEE